VVGVFSGVACGVVSPLPSWCGSQDFPFVFFVCLQVFVVAFSYRRSGASCFFCCFCCFSVVLGAPPPPSMRLGCYPWWWFVGASF